MIRQAVLRHGGAPLWAMLGGPVVVALAGCAASGPLAEPASPPAPAQWHAPVAAAPATDPQALSRWWQQFDDPVLSRLVAQAEADSPSLTQAWARIERARASLQVAQASGVPMVNANAAVARAKQASATGVALPPQTVRNAGWDASWELDLWGKARQQTEAAQARVQARVADWHGTRVSLSAEVADAYVQYRSCGRLVQVHKRERLSLRKTERAIAAAVQAGFSAAADGALARAGVASADAALVAQQTQCEWWVKSLVALTGLDEPGLRTLLGQGAVRVPEPVALAVPGVPAQVLRQRPDLGSLEGELLAAAADIGVARAELYPSLSLSGAVTVAASSLASSATSWTFGPVLALPLFDGGRRRGAVAGAEAAYQAAWAAYRHGVRGAVKEVEQGLVQLDGVARRAEQAAVATREYRSFFASTELNWRAGGVDLLTLEEARRLALSAETNEIVLGRERLQHWIGLYKALGGGWQDGQAAVSPTALAETQQNNAGGTP